MTEVDRLIRSHIREMPAYEPVQPFTVHAQQLGLLPERIIKLDANENPYGTLPVVGETLSRLAFAHTYPDPESRELRQALAAYHDVPVENLLAGAGADELIDLVIRFFLDPGDAILNCPPTFGMYAFDAGVNNARVINVPRKADFSLDLEAIMGRVREDKPKLIFLASPNNPDGGLISTETLGQLLALPMIVVLDEAYVEFAPPGTSRLNLVPERENLIVLRTFSKWAGLAGFRVGYGGFPTSLMPLLWKIKQPYNVSTAALVAAVESIRYADQLEAIGQKIVAERERLYRSLSEFTWLKPYPSHSNFILCRVLSTAKVRNAAQLKRDLAEVGILIRYFEKPGLDDHIRISVGKPEHTDALVKQLTRWE